jgi:hypothetical protein
LFAGDPDHDGPPGRAEFSEPRRGYPALLGLDLGEIA